MCYCSSSSNGQLARQAPHYWTGLQPHIPGLEPTVDSLLGKRLTARLRLQPHVQTFFLTLISHGDSSRGHLACSMLLNRQPQKEVPREHREGHVCNLCSRANRAAVYSSCIFSRHSFHSTLNVINLDLKKFRLVGDQRELQEWRDDVKIATLMLKSWWHKLWVTSRGWLSMLLEQECMDG